MTDHTLREGEPMIDDIQGAIAALKPHGVVFTPLPSGWLWRADGYGEVTAAQLLDIAERNAGFRRTDASTLRERVRERLAEIIADELDGERFGATHRAADAILREFRLQPVAVGKVDAETGEVGELDPR